MFIGSGNLLRHWLGDRWGDRVYNLLGGIFIALIVYSVIYLPIANHVLGESNHADQQKIYVVDNKILPFACVIAANEYPAQHIKCPPLPNLEPSK